MKIEVIRKGDLLINKKYKNLSFLGEFSFNNIWNCNKFQFFRKKYYRVIEIYSENNTKFFIKKYLKNGKEAQKEWENIILLKEKDFLTSVPVFFSRCGDKAIIGTEEIRGVLLIDLIKKSPSRTDFYISKLAEFLGSFHQAGFFHQDCYLNHFFYDENANKIMIIDVSRVKYKPKLSRYYFIKDMAQLKFSFYTYLGGKAENYWRVFWKVYTKTRTFKFSKIFSQLIDFKMKLIKRHTERARAKGREI